MRCPSCGESSKKSARFCSNCGVALKGAEGGQAPTLAGPAANRPKAPFVLSVVAVVGLIAVALSMSFTDDAPGDIGSPIAGLFHSVGAVQLMIGLGVLTCSIFLQVRGFDAELWGNVILALGLVSVGSLLLIVVEGTFAVIFLAIPGVLAVLGGLLARRSGAAG